MQKHCTWLIIICFLTLVFIPIGSAEDITRIKLYVAEKHPNRELRYLFTKDHPNVEFVDVQIDWSLVDPLERIQGIEKLDILEITNDEGIRKLVRSNLVESLTSPEILDEHKKYIPQVQDLLESDGMIIGIPIHLEILPWMIYQELWDELKLPDPPKTFLEYISLVALWHIEFSLNYPDLAVAGDPGWGGTRMTLILNLIDQYVYEQQQAEELLQFSNNHLKALIESICSVEELSYPEKFRGPLIQGRYDSDFWTIDITDLQILEEGRKTGWVPMLPPVIIEGSQPKIGGNLTALCLLQQSENKDIATEYLNFVANHKDRYQAGLSQMLLSLENFTDSDSIHFSTDAIAMWNAFVPYITFHTDALGGHCQCVPFEQKCGCLHHSWLP